MLAEVLEFAVQPVIAAGAEPLRRVRAVTVLRNEVEIDRQLQVMHAFAVTQQ